MVSFPQPGACLCRAVEYLLLEDPLTVYACHCSDCQSQTGTSFSLSMIMKRESLEITRGHLEYFSVELEDGREKGAHWCERCRTQIWGPSRGAGLVMLIPGTLDNTSWVVPAGHIWTSSAQPWIEIPSDRVSSAQAPSSENTIAMVKAWKQRQAAK